MFVSTNMMDVPVVNDQRRGAIGVDLNADHLAVAETDASGNCLDAWRAPLVTYGKSQQQAEALIGDAAAKVVDYVTEVGKPIVIEGLDFRQKKAVLEGESRKYSRMLSSFSYGRVKAYFLSRGYRDGVAVHQVHQVNPAYSSVIGPGEVHGAVRADGTPGSNLGAGPTPARLLVTHSAPSGGTRRQWRHVAFTVPARKRVKHVWTYWGAVLGRLTLALAAQHRLGMKRRKPNPVQAGCAGSGRGVA